jgi:hypothetical protein
MSATGGLQVKAIAELTGPAAIDSGLKVPMTV